jgi:hypothetical protein
MSIRQQKMFQAANLLSKYYGLKTQRDLAAVIALEQVASPRQQGRRTETTTHSPGARGDAYSPEAKLIELLIDTSTGALLTKDLLKELHGIKEGLSREQIARLGSLVQIHYTGETQVENVPGNFAITANEGDAESNGHITVNQSTKSVRDILNRAEHPNVNNTPNDPSKTSPALSVILSNSTRVSPLAKFTNPITIFLNGIPNLEISRAIPYVNLEFLVDRPPISPDNRLQTISLPKFLLGAERASTGVLRGMAQANRVLSVGLNNPEEPNGEPRQRAYTRGGMELFTAPQTMVNADQFDVINSVRANPVLDKFRPFLSLQEVNINIVPSTGIMSYKTAKVKMVLHDRSRMNEISEFIRPDFYSRTEVEIEYGWMHPDNGINNITSQNVYGDLINGMRVKEKFMIRNSSFSFDSSGQVVVNLDLAMRGASEFDTEIISTNDQQVGEAVRQLRNLEETIATLRERVFPPNTPSRGEIRGVQVLNAAQDARNNLTFTSDFNQQLTQLRRQLENSKGRPEVAGLLNAIRSIYGGSITKSSGVRQSGGAAQQVRTSIIREITAKVEHLKNSAESDPFLITTGEASRRTVANARGEEEGRRRREYNERQITVATQFNASVSLGKLLLYFIGEPLAATQRYDDIQMIFYPFNIKAGKANRINIANFLVDLDYFADEYARYRLAHLGRDGTMTLRQFMQFVQNTLIDDHGAASYGIGSLFETVISSDGTSTETRARSEPSEYTQQLENLLRNVTPDGTFTMPIVDFYIEALPQKITRQDATESEDSSSEKTILRIHIFDRAASSYDSLGSLLQASRSSQIISVGRALNTVPDVPTNNGVNQAHAESWRRAIADARARGLIEYYDSNTGQSITGEDPGSDAAIRFTGGSGQSLKDFLMSSMPYIIYGAAGTGITNATLSSMQNQQLSTVNMLRSFRRRGEVLPNGQQPGALPMQIIPTELSLDMFGCPLISFAQQFFIDFQTGTTADNIYGVSTLEHRITPGEFKTSAKFVPMDAFGTYASLAGRMNTVSIILQDIQNESNRQRQGGG